MQVSELDMMGLSGLLEFLSYEINKPDPQTRDTAYAILRGLVENIYLQPLEPEDAVAVQAFALTLLKETPAHLSDRDQVIRNLAAITVLVEAVGGALERLTGKSLAAHAFFENQAKIIQQ